MHVQVHQERALLRRKPARPRAVATPLRRLLRAAPPSPAATLQGSHAGPDALKAYNRQLLQANSQLRDEVHTLKLQVGEESLLCLTLARRCSQWRLRA